MMKKIKAVIIGFSHMHVNEVALYISEREDIELVAVADVDSGNEQIEGYRYTQKWNFLPAILRLSLENGSFLWYIV